MSLESGLVSCLWYPGSQYARCGIFQTTGITTSAPGAVVLAPAGIEVLSTMEWGTTLVHLKKTLLAISAALKLLKVVPRSMTDRWLGLQARRWLQGEVYSLAGY